MVKRNKKGNKIKLELNKQQIESIRNGAAKVVFGINENQMAFSMWKCIKETASNADSLYIKEVCPIQPNQEYYVSDTNVGNIQKIVFENIEVKRIADINVKDIPKIQIKEFDFDYWLKKQNITSKYIFIADIKEVEIK